MPRISLWKDGKHTNDYKFQDKRIAELLNASGVGINVHKYLGTNDQGNTGDATQPQYLNQSEKNIQDLLFMENRDRHYDPDIYTLRGHYNAQDTDFNLSQFGLAVSNDTIFMAFHINDMIERLGRRIVSGDVLELHNLRDFDPLDPDNAIPVALRKFYVVQEATRGAEGFGPTWWPHLWRVKITPMVDGQEYREILNATDAGEPGFGTGTDGNPISNYMSTYQQELNINDAIVEQAETDVPKSGYDVTPYYIGPTNENGDPVPDVSFNADGNVITTDRTDITADYTYLTPKRDYQGYLVGDGLAPNGYPVTSATYFPENSVEGDYVLRLDFYPNILFRYDGRRWIRVENAERALLTGSANETQKGEFINNQNTWRSGSETLDERVYLSEVLKIRADE